MDILFSYFTFLDLKKVVKTPSGYRVKLNGLLIRENHHYVYKYKFYYFVLFSNLLTDFQLKSWSDI